MSKTAPLPSPRRGTRSRNSSAAEQGRGSSVWAAEGGAGVESEPRSKCVVSTACQAGPRSASRTDISSAEGGMWGAPGDRGLRSRLTRRDLKGGGFD